MDKTLKTSLDIRDNSLFQDVYAIENDYGYTLEIAITCNGKAFDISDLSPKFQMIRFGDVIELQSNKNSNVISINITDEMVTKCGRFPFQITLTHGDSIKITTVTNYFCVRKDGGA